MRFALLVLLAAALMLANLFLGSVNIPCREVWHILTGSVSGTPQAFIVMQSRLPMALTAALAGAALATSGLLMQTAFRNPLAGPSVLGVNSGASLGVALVMLGGAGAIGSLWGSFAVVGAAFAGSAAIIGLLLLLSAVVRNTLMLLIAGIMVGYLASSVITLLNYGAGADAVQGYVMWGMSSFSTVGTSRMWLFGMLVAAGLIPAMLLAKPLDLLTLGDDYARNLGVDLQRVRHMLLLSTGILASAVTAFCGPVSFIGLAVPHITRLIFASDSHARLLPGVMITGACVALGCNLLCVLPFAQVLPLNAVTPLIGAPVVIWILLTRNR